jgi:hypothetical protein
VRYANENGRRRCANRENSKSKKLVEKPKRNARSARSNARRRRKKELGGKSARNSDVQSVSVSGKRNGDLKSNEKRNDRKDMNAGDEKSAKDTVTGIDLGTVIAVEPWTETETGIETATVTALAQ